MPLTGQAKTDYQREYMRRRRAKADAVEALGLAHARARIAELEARVAELEGQIDDMEATFAEFLEKQHIPPALRKAVLSFLHPDQFTDRAKKKRAEETMQEFNQYFRSRTP